MTDRPWTEPEDVVADGGTVQLPDDGTAMEPSEPETELVAEDPAPESGMGSAAEPASTPDPIREAQPASEPELLTDPEPSLGPDPATESELDAAADPGTASEPAPVPKPESPP